MTALGPEKRPTNMVFQGYGLFPHMNVAQNIGYGLRLQKMPKGEIDARVGETIALVQLADLANRGIDQLSGGQQQRVALARALVMRPKVLLLDEPLAALDLKLRQAMQEELRRIHHEIGGTFVFVTHDQSEALGLANRIAVMRDGRLEQVGTAQEIYASPRTRFVSTFIGEANLLPGRRSNGTVTLAAGPQFAEAGADGEISVVVRPENLLALGARRDGRNGPRGHSPRHRLSRLACEIQSCRGRRQRDDRPCPAGRHASHGSRRDDADRLARRQSPHRQMHDRNVIPRQSGRILKTGEETMNTNHMSFPSLTRRSALKAAFAAAAAATGLVSVRALAASTVTFLGWQGYDDPVIFDDFTKTKGITLNTTYIGNNDEIITKLRSGGLGQIDIVTPYMGYIPLLAKLDLIQPIDTARVPNLEKIIPLFRNDPNVNVDGKLYGVPFTWGSGPMMYDPAVYSDAA